MLQTSVRPGGRFFVGVHQPAYAVANLRALGAEEQGAMLGQSPEGATLDNAANYPPQDLQVAADRPIYEILNPLPFRGCTFIDPAWADACAADPGRIRLNPPPPVSLSAVLGQHCPPETVERILRDLPLPLRYELAARSTDPDELILLARSCCELLYAADQTNPSGLRYALRNGQLRPVIHNHELFETIANNLHLPDAYKEIMVLRPGAQGSSTIVGDTHQGSSHVLEYLRTNSYIAGGHYAANFSPASIRYRIADLSAEDMQGLRHLYYQRSYVALAQHLGLQPNLPQRALNQVELEALRLQLLAHLRTQGQQNNQASDDWATLWGWNFGYDFTGSGYRLHASHQMIHQQYALIPQEVHNREGDSLPAYACGDLVAEVVARYASDYGSDFFDDYLQAIRNNVRTDGGSGAASLIVWQDERVLLFVPKAQVSQWELQIMTLGKASCEDSCGPVGNIVEADAATRHSLDTALLKAQQALAGLGAQMVTSIEYSKRLGRRNQQHLLYALLPKLPWAMGGFSEAQGRFICGHYPEDFALACRRQLA